MTPYFQGNKTDLNNPKKIKTLENIVISDNF